MNHEQEGTYWHFLIWMSNGEFPSEKCVCE